MTGKELHAFMPERTAEGLAQPIAPGDLAARAGIPLAEAVNLLLGMEDRELVRRLPGGRYVRIR